MNVASIVEMPTVPSAATRPAETPPVSNPPPQTFKESLLALSKPASETGASHQAGPTTVRRQSSAGDDTKLPITMPHSRAVLSSVPTPQGRQHVLADQQPSLINLAPIPIKPPVSAPVLPPKQFMPSGPAMCDAESVAFSQTPSNTALLAVAKPLSLLPSMKSIHAQRETNAPQAVAIVPVSQTTPDVTNTVVKTATDAWSSALSHSPLITTPDAANPVVTKAAPNAIADPANPVATKTVPIAIPDAANTVATKTVLVAIPDAANPVATKTVPIAIPDAANAVATKTVPVAIPDAANPVGAVPVAIPDAANPVGAVPIAIPDAANPVVAETVPSAIQNFSQTLAPDVVSSAVSSAVPKAVQSPSARVLPSPMQMVAPGPVPVSAPIIAPIAVPAPSVLPVAVHRNVPNPEPNAMPIALPVSLAEATQSIAFNPAVPHAVPALNTDPAPALHPSVNALAKGEAPVSPSPASTAAASPAPTSDPTASAVLTVPGTTADQLAVFIQSGGPSPTSTQVSSNSAAVAKPAGVLGANGTNVTNNAISNPAAGKQHPASQAQSQTGDASASPDQNQPVAAQQEQSSTPVQTSFANHIATPMEHAPNGAAGAPLQNSPPLPAHTKAQDNAPAAVLPSTPALPVINTARLIQNMGQSEMRVGMRSPDFGNISISTSATRDLVSAQISLEHSELARTLAVHLPEMQERLGNTHQAMNVRIDLNGQATGQGTGTSAGMSNGSADGSRGDRQQRNSAASTQAANGFSGQLNSVVTATAPTGDGRLNARLDITA